MYELKKVMRRVSTPYKTIPAFVFANLLAVVPWPLLLILVELAPVRGLSALQTRHENIGRKVFQDTPHMRLTGTLCRSANGPTQNDNRKGQSGTFQN